MNTAVAMELTERITRARQETEARQAAKGDARFTLGLIKGWYSPYLDRTAIIRRLPGLSPERVQALLKHNQEHTFSEALTAAERTAVGTIYIQYLREARLIDRAQRMWFRDPYNPSGTIEFIGSPGRERICMFDSTNGKTIVEWQVTGDSISRLN